MTKLFSKTRVSGDHSWVASLYILSMLCIFALPLPAATYFVAKVGLDTNPGTTEAPFRTLAKGLNTVMPGDSLLIGQGDYGDEGQVVTTKNGTAQGRITIDGQGVATIKQLSVKHPYYTIQNTTFRGFTNSWANVVTISRGAHWTIVSNCVVDMEKNYYVRGLQFQEQAVYPWDITCASDCQILNNRFTGGGRVIIGLAGFRNLIQSNYIHDVWRTEAVVQIYGGDQVIRANRIVNILETPGISGHVDVFETTGNSAMPIKGMTNCLVERNWVENIHGQPVSIVDYGHPESLYGYVFRNNIFVKIKQPAQNTITQSRFYNNTFYNCNWEFDGHAIGWSWSNNETKSPPGTNEYAHGGRSFNNAFLHNGNLSKGSTNAGWYSFTYSDAGNPPGLPLKNCLADANYVSAIVDGAPYQPVRPGTVPIGDGYAWNNQQFYEINGINGGDPGFYDETAYDFRLHEDSILIGAGLDLTDIEPTWATMTNDFFGNPRDPRNPSIGAVEFVTEGTSFRHISPDGNDASDGSYGAPWRTIQHGVNNLEPGLTLRVGAGNYGEAVTIGVSGTIEAPIVIDGAGAAITKRFNVGSRSNLVIRGFIFQGNTPTSVGAADIALAAGARDVTIANCIWTNTVYWKGFATFDAATRTITGDANWRDLGFVEGQVIGLERGELGVPLANTASRTVTDITGNVMTVSTALTDAEQVTYITGHRGWMIYVPPGIDNVTVAGCLFSNLTYSAVLLAGQNSLLVSNKWHAMQGWDHNAVTGTNNVVAWNQHYDSPYVACIVSADVMADYPQFTFGSVTYSNNWVQNIQGLIRFGHWNEANRLSGPQVWANNVFIDVNELSFVQPNLTVTNNLFLRVAKVPDASYSAVGHAMRLHPGGDYTITNVSILNNIFVDCGYNSLSTGGWYNLNQHTNFNVTADYNFVAGVQPTFIARTGFDEGRATLKGGDPGFVNINEPLGPDGIPFTLDDGMRLAAGSKLIGAGYQGANIGAYQSGGPGDPPPDKPLSPTSLRIDQP